MPVDNLWITVDGVGTRKEMAESNNELLWSETLKQLKAELGEGVFSAWFTDVSYLRSGDNSVTIAFPSAFHRDRIKKNYLNDIRAKLKSLAGKEIALELELITEGTEKTTSVPQEPASAPPVEIKEEPEIIQKTKNPPVQKPKRDQHPKLRDDYTFERYVIGENNNFAANVAIAISRNPGTNYNPFFIYGGVGLGKTHLMQAIGNYIHENSDKKVIYVTSEEFLNEYLECIAQRTMNLFKNKFRRVDTLLIDDIQFFADKPGVQEELFHTFNTVLNAKSQVVLPATARHRN